MTTYSAIAYKTNLGEYTYFLLDHRHINLHAKSLKNHWRIFCEETKEFIGKDVEETFLTVNDAMLYLNKFVSLLPVNQPVFKVEDEILHIPV